MTEDDNQGSPSAPGSSAADAAPTQAIPRIPKPAKGPAKKVPGKNAPTAKAAPVTSMQTDKGRTRPGSPIKRDDTSGSGADRSESKPQVKPGTGPTGRPLTAADYSRTTKGSPSTTAVIPAVKDRIEKFKDRDKKKSGSTTTLTPGPDAGSGRRASLRLTRVEPWSVTRLAFAVSVAMMIVSVVAVMIFWVVLEATGVWDQINGSVTSVLSDDASSFSITDYLGFSRLVGLALVLSAINVILMTALATIAAHLYNLAAQLLGGVELTFAEEK
ncbi:DUF3566 domain-containing protein [Aeromicrobium sp.]|uniref:DUF3566 domain-containing protein n=1 Tax=Aeromicrobium sp. TaxID=1871063 RepID=UPI0030C616BA